MKHQIMTIMLDAFLIINALSPSVSAKTLPPFTFSMVHLLHRLYGVDAPGHIPDKYDMNTDLAYILGLLRFYCSISSSVLSVFSHKTTVPVFLGFGSVYKDVYRLKQNVNS